MERALVVVDGSANAKLVAGLAGMFAAQEQVLATVMETAGDRDAEERPGLGYLSRIAALTMQRTTSDRGEDSELVPQMSAKELVQGKPIDTDDAVEIEALKGYSIAFVGLEQSIAPDAGRFAEPLQRLVDVFDGPLAVALNGAFLSAEPPRPLRILVPTGGTPEAHLAMEVGLSLAKASGGTITVLNV